MGGLPCIKGIRFPVATVIAMVADGMTVEEILREHPGLTLVTSGITDFKQQLTPRYLSVRRLRPGC
jgi:uncharacterized protein (DUF433 family)